MEGLLEEIMEGLVEEIVEGRVEKIMEGLVEERVEGWVWKIQTSSKGGWEEEMESEVIFR